MSTSVTDDRRRHSAYRVLLILLGVLVLLLGIGALLALPVSTSGSVDSTPVSVRPS